MSELIKNSSTKDNIILEIFLFPFSHPTTYILHCTLFKRKICIPAIVGQEVVIPQWKKNCPTQPNTVKRLKVLLDRCLEKEFLKNSIRTLYWEFYRTKCIITGHFIRFDIFHRFCSTQT